MKSPVSVVIVNYRTAALLEDCLRSLVGELASFPLLQVIVVDNDSGDGSFELLQRVVEREVWGGWVTVVAAGRNGGFSFGNNVGIRLALASDAPPDMVLLLNPDTVVKSGALAALVAFMEERPEVGIAGSALENPEGHQESSCHAFPSPLSELDSGLRFGPVSRLLHRYVVSPPLPFDASACDWVSGACMLIRKGVFGSIGLMDDDFFLYFEEVDFCRRAKLAGWGVWFVPQSRVVHLEGAATNIREKRQRRPKYWYDSRRRFFIKHYGLSGLVLSDALWFFGRVAWLIRQAVTPIKWGKSRDPKWFMFDLLWGDFKSIGLGEHNTVPRIGSRES